MLIPLLDITMHNRLEKKSVKTKLTEQRNGVTNYVTFANIVTVWYHFAHIKDFLYRGL